MPNSTCSPCRSGAYILQGASRRWTDDRDSICRDSIHRCHIAGIGCLCAATAETRHCAATAETACRAAAGETPCDGGGACWRYPAHLTRSVRRLGRLYRLARGNKVCFALAKPKTTKTKPAGRKRDPSYVFVATRPAENVKNEVSVIIGYSFKSTPEVAA